MTFPALSVEISFTTGPLAVPTWTDITTYVKTISIATGRNEQGIDGYQPGTLSLTLDNSDRRFDPFHTGGPYYGNLLPRKRVRVRCTHASVTYFLYQGFVDGWPQTTYRPPKEAETSITATDLMGFLANVTLPESVYAIEIADDDPIYWYRLGDESNTAREHARRYHGTYQIDAASMKGPALINGSTSGGMAYKGGNTSTADPAPIVRSGAAGLPGSFPLSLEAWFQPEAVKNANLDFHYAVALNVVGPQIRANLGLAADATTKNWKISCFRGDGTTGWTSLSSNTYALQTGSNHVVALIGATAPGISLYLNGDLIASGANSGAIAAPTTDEIMVGLNAKNGLSPSVGCVFDEVAVYEGLLTTTQIDNHFVAGALPWFLDRTGARVDRILDLAAVLAHDRNIDSGYHVLSVADLKGMDTLAYLRLMEATEYGAAYVDHSNDGRLRFRDRNGLASDPRRLVAQVTFTDQDSQGDAVWDSSTWDSTSTGWAGTIRMEPESLNIEQIERHIANDVIVNWQFGTEQSGDFGSQVVYGKRSLTVDTLIGNADDAKIRADTVMLVLKDIKTRVSSPEVNLAAANSTQATLVLGLRIGDRVGLRFHPQQVGSPIATEHHIEGINHEIADGINEWRTTFNLSLAL